MQAKPGDLLLFLADTFEVTCKGLHLIRKRFGAELKLYDPATMHFSWITEFPMFAKTEEEGETGWAAMHHPFTAPRPQDLELLKTDPEKCRAVAYDLVINGSEAGGGTIRIHDQAIQQQVFSLLVSTSKHSATGSDSCWTRCNSARRHTAGSRWALIAGSCSLRGSTTSAT